MFPPCYYMFPPCYYMFPPCYYMFPPCYYMFPPCYYTFPPCYYMFPPCYYICSLLVTICFLLVTTRSLLVTMISYDLVQVLRYFARMRWVCGRGRNWYLSILFLPMWFLNWCIHNFTVQNAQRIVRIFDVLLKNFVIIGYFPIKRVVCGSGKGLWILFKFSHAVFGVISYSKIAIRNEKKIGMKIWGIWWIISVFKYDFQIFNWVVAEEDIISEGKYFNTIFFHSYAAF